MHRIQRADLTLVRSVLIAVFAGVAAGCSDSSGGDGCKETEECASGEVCVEGGCIRLCRSYTDCSGGCYTNEGGSHKACSGTVILDAPAGAQMLELQVSVENGNFRMDGNDRIQWTAFLLP